MKKFLAVASGFGLFLVLAFSFIMVRQDKGNGFVFDNSSIIEPTVSQNDGFFIVDDELKSVSIDITSKTYKQLMEFQGNGLELGDFAHLYTYYIPNQMSHIIAAYHYENLMSDTFVPFSRWSGDAYENKFMTNSGQYLYDLFLLGLTEDTLEYGFVPLNKTVQDSTQFRKIAIKHFDWLYN